MERYLHDFLILNIIFAAVNTILLGVLVWQLWVVRSRVDRFEFVVASFVGCIGNGVRSVLQRAAGFVQQSGRAVERAFMGR
jgi:hypothetical protein